MEIRDASKDRDTKTASARTLRWSGLVEFLPSRRSDGSRAFPCDLPRWLQVERRECRTRPHGRRGRRDSHADASGRARYRLRAKRALIAAGIIALAVGALSIALTPNLLVRDVCPSPDRRHIEHFRSGDLRRFAGDRGTPHLFDRRQGRNQTFNSAGNVAAAVSMGLLGYFVSDRSIFSSCRAARSQLSSHCSSSVPMRSITGGHGRGGRR